MSETDHRAMCLLGGWIMVWAMARLVVGLERLWDRWHGGG